MCLNEKGIPIEFTIQDVKSVHPIKFCQPKTKRTISYVKIIRAKSSVCSTGGLYTRFNGTTSGSDLKELEVIIYHIIKDSPIQRESASYGKFVGGCWCKIYGTSGPEYIEVTNDGCITRAHKKPTSLGSTRHIHIHIPADPNLAIGRIFRGKI